MMNSGIITLNNWYSLVKDNTLEQGDILEGIKIPVPTYEFLTGVRPDVEIDIVNVVIITQTCDLVNGKTKWVQVSVLTDLSLMQQEHDVFSGKKNLEKIRRGYLHNYHMLAECDIDSHKREIGIIDFRNVSSVPIEYVKDFVSQGQERRRLNSPYKEHLAQAYARFFMRVGLPIDIPKFA